MPQFVSYFAPVIEIMRDLGGQARPRQVLDELIKRHHIPQDFLALTNKNGGSKLENRVHFARSYLFKAGVMTSPIDLERIGEVIELAQDVILERRLRPSGKKLAAVVTAVYRTEIDRIGGDPTANFDVERHRVLVEAMFQGSPGVLK